MKNNKYINADKSKTNCPKLHEAPPGAKGEGGGGGGGGVVPVFLSESKKCTMSAFYRTFRRLTLLSELWRERWPFLAISSMCCCIFLGLVA